MQSQGHRSSSWAVISVLVASLTEPSYDSRQFSRRHVSCGARSWVRGSDKETRTKDAGVSDEDWSARSARAISPCANTPQRGFRRPAKPGLSVQSLPHKTCQCRSPAISRRCRFESERMRRSSSAPANLVITSRSIPGGRRANGERARRGDQSQPLFCFVVAAAMWWCECCQGSGADGGLPRGVCELEAMLRVLRRQTCALRGSGGGARARDCQAAAEMRAKSVPSARRAEGVPDA